VRQPGASPEGRDRRRFGDCARGKWRRIVGYPVDDVADQPAGHERPAERETAIATLTWPLRIDRRVMPAPAVPTNAPAPRH